MRKFRMLMLLMLIVLLAAPLSYGSEQTFGDGQVKIDLPENWQVVDEADREDVLRVVCSAEEKEVSQYMDYYHSLMMAEDPSADPKAMMQILYTTDYSDAAEMDFSDCTDEELEAFYQEQEGKSVLENAVLFLTFGVTETSDEMEILSNSWGKFIHAQMTETMQDGSKLYHQMYFTKKGSAVITLSLTTSGPPSKQSVGDIEEVVSSYSDDGWYDDYMMAADTDSYDDEYSDSDDGWMVYAFLIIIVVCAVIYVAAGKRTNSAAAGYGRRPADRKQEQVQMTAGETTGYPPASDKRKVSIKLPKTKSVTADGKSMQVRDSQEVKAKTPDESYLESLRTLMDSGLLTKEEYRDMVEAHNRNKRI